MPVSGKTSEDPLQKITAYFLSDDYREHLVEVQGRHPGLLAVRRSTAKKAVKHARSVQADDDGPPIDPVQDARIDKLLQAASSASHKGEQTHAEYEMPLFDLITVAEMHYEPPAGGRPLSFFPAHDSDAARFMLLLRPKIEQVRDTLAAEAEPTRDTDAVTFLNNTLRCIDEFARIESGSHANGHANGTGRSAATHIRKKERIKKKPADETPETPPTSGGRSM